MLRRCDVRIGKKGGSSVGKTKRGKASKIMAIADAGGTPIAIHVASASPHETTLVAPTLAARFTEEAPTRLVGDRAYDSDRLDAELIRQGIEMIAPHRRNRKKSRRRTGGSSGATDGAGRSNGCLLGFRTSAASPCVMIGMMKAISGLACSDASSSSSGRFSDDF